MQFYLFVVSLSLLSESISVFVDVFAIRKRFVLHFTLWCLHRNRRERQSRSNGKSGGVRFDAPNRFLHPLRHRRRLHLHGGNGDRGVAMAPRMALVVAFHTLDAKWLWSPNWGPT